MTFIAVLFCFPVQTFTEIGQWAAKLWPKKRQRAFLFQQIERLIYIIVLQKL